MSRQKKSKLNRPLSQFLVKDPDNLDYLTTRRSSYESIPSLTGEKWSDWVTKYQSKKKPKTKRKAKSPYPSSSTEQWILKKGKKQLNTCGIKWQSYKNKVKKQRWPN